MSELWVVETWSDNEWRPCTNALGVIDANMSYPLAYRNLLAWRVEHFTSKYRLRKYSREPSGKRSLSYRVK